MKKLVLFALGALLLVSCSTTKNVASNATGAVDQYRYDIEYVKNAAHVQNPVFEKLKKLSYLS